jgi:hypothetical protein
MYHDRLSKGGPSSFWMGEGKKPYDIFLHMPKENSEELKQNILKLLYHNFTLGEAFGNTMCLYDSIAQVKNQPSEEKKYFSDEVKEIVTSNDIYPNCSHEAEGVILCKALKIQLYVITLNTQNCTDMKYELINQDDIKQLGGPLSEDEICNNEIVTIIYASDIGHYIPALRKTDYTEDKRPRSPSR